MGKNDTVIYNLTKKMLLFLFAYFFALLLLGGVFSITLACNLTRETPPEQIIKLSFLASIASSGMLCSVQYIRRLYKACLSDRIDTSNDIIKCIGNLTYFFFRPFFAFTFAIVMVFMLLSGMCAVTGTLDYVLNRKFIYLCIVMSSFLGYSIGKFLDRFEKISKEKASNLL